jgi:hypothetical protein
MKFAAEDGGKSKKNKTTHIAPRAVLGAHFQPKEWFKIAQCKNSPAFFHIFFSFSFSPPVGLL